MARNIPAPQGAGAANPGQQYLDKLYKIIPAEITAGYTAIASFLWDPIDPLSNINVLLGFAVFLAIINPLYLYRLQNVRNTMQIVVSTISFPIWAACISTPLVTGAISDITPQIITVVMVAWVLATPLLVPGETVE
jgi:hypothetical protein